MNIKIMIALSSIVLTACGTNQEKKIYGAWTSIDNIDSTGMNVSDELRFEKYGIMQMTMYAHGDSIISQMKGTFEIDRSGKNIRVEGMGVTFEHKIIRLDHDTLELLTGQGITMRMIKK